MDEGNKPVEPVSTAPSPEQDLPKETPSEAPKEEPKQDIDFEKEYQALEAKAPPRKTREDELKAAQYSLNSLKKRIKDLGGEVEETPAPVEDKFEQFATGFVRQQAEAEIRKRSKSEAEVKYKLWFYDHKIVKSGNVFSDVDDAEWLANKNRTQNALQEMKNAPTAADTSGPGQKTPHVRVVALPKEEEMKLLQAGYKKVSPSKYEGTRFVYRFDEVAAKWIQEKK